MPENLKILVLHKNLFCDYFKWNLGALVVYGGSARTIRRDCLELWQGLVLQDMGEVDVHVFPQTVLALRGSYFFCIEYALESAKTCDPPSCLDLPSSFYEKTKFKNSASKTPSFLTFHLNFFYEKTFKNRASKTPSFLTFHLDALLPRLA